MSMQKQFKVANVDMGLVAELAGNPDSQYYAAMSFQLGVSIGELIGMGVSRETLLAACAHLVDMAIIQRTEKPEEPKPSLIIQ